MFLQIASEVDFNASDVSLEPAIELYVENDCSIPGCGPYDKNFLQVKCQPTDPDGYRMIRYAWLTGGLLSD